MSANASSPLDPAAAAAAQHELAVAQKQGQAIVIWTVGMYVAWDADVLSVLNVLLIGSVS